MKITKSELVKIDAEREYPYVLDEMEFHDYPYLRALRKLNGLIIIGRDALGELEAQIQLSGEMICPCAISLEDVELAFTIDEKTSLSFNPQDEGYYIGEELDLDDLVINFVLPEVPIKVVKNAEIEYPSGDGWCVMTEADLKHKQTTKVDPRLAILKEYQFDEEE